MTQGDSGGGTGHERIDRPRGDENIRRHYDQRFTSLEVMINERLGSVEKLAVERWNAHAREHKMLFESIDRAREVVDQRLEGMNELRQQINVERGRYIDRTTFEMARDGLSAQMAALAKEITALGTRIGSLETRLNTALALVVFLVPLVIFVVNYVAANRGP